MKISYYFHLLLLIFFAISCGNKNSYILNGNISGLKNSEAYIVSGTNLHIDTVRIKSGKFTYRGVSQTVDPLVIYMENGSVWITIWVQNNENFLLTGNAHYPEMMMVKGGDINKLLSDFKTENLSLIKERCDLRDNLSARTEHASESGTSVNNAQLSSQLKNVDQMLKTRAQDFIKAHPSSVAALVMIQDYILDVEHASEIQPLLNLLTGDARANPLYDKLNALCMRDLQTKAGQPALDFNIENMQNDTINLDTFKNKYLILTFATSQCEFCKPEYAELLNIKKKFPEKDLAILTVSLDENKGDWKKSAQENGINWAQAIDSAGWSSKIASLYNVLSVPCNYLIDKDKMIIGSKLRIDSIQSILCGKLEVKDKKAKG